LTVPGLRFDDRVVVVTGAGRNLGREYALELAARGAKVVVNDLGVAISDTDGTGDAPDRNPALDVVEEIWKLGGEAVVSLDSVATADGGAAIVQAALDEWGRIDALVNNAGVVRQAPMADHGPEVWEPVLASQLGGHLNVIRPAWAAMAARGGGRILNVSSGAGLWGVAEMASYATAKMGVVGLTRALALEGAPLGIAVNVIAPSAKTRPGGFGPIPASPRLHEWMSVDQVAALAVWLVHDDCTATGECFSVGAGYVGRVAIAVNEGFHGRPLTPESVRDAWAQVMADGSWTPLPAGSGDIPRMLEGFDESPGEVDGPAPQASRADKP
jgi:NAD(P)-dependent dehydrogenase (short-subunit alcohol dehydrogenase family)